VTRVRTTAAVAASKLASAATRVTRRGGGTALPGLVAERLDPQVVANLGRTLGRGRVVVTGTNGKTTTSRILAAAFDAADVPYIHNREGSNLMRGMASTLTTAAGVSGAIHNARATAGLFETDEATMPAAVAALKPRVIVFTNLFRDQLDRYGEVDTVAGLWRAALQAAPRDCTLVLNADDPSVAEMAVGWSGPVHWFGLDDPTFATDARGAFDARWCSCGGDYAYERRYFAHIGIWRCTNCDRARPPLDTSASSVTLGLDSATMNIDQWQDAEFGTATGRERIMPEQDSSTLSTSLPVPGSLSPTSMPLTGLYNVYNALAAIAACRAFGLPEEATRAGLAAVRPAFGRQEVVQFEGRRLRLFLAKNPAGANQVLLLLREIARERPPLKLALFLNDRFADGQDVSWIWDVDYELLRDSAGAWWAGGDRAEDLAVRLKYAGWPRASIVDHDASSILNAILGATVAGDDIFVIPTYTAMLDLREELARRGAVAGRLR
jgi:UDP-N-acetylmuramyl tripeptide synthase